MPGELYIARTGGVANVDGVITYIVPGMTAREGHPILQCGMFVPLVVDFEVEAAKPARRVPAAKPAAGSGAVEAAPPVVETPVTAGPVQAAAAK